VKKWLDRYFDGEKPDLSELPLAPTGGEFRRMVWDILCEIPYGEVVTYGDIAKKMAQKMKRKSMSSQAVGGAVGHNPISIIIPCHRVVGSNGSLTGYAGGIDKKIKLLELEGADISSLFVPTKGTAL
jgi:methylated-DNA-[protein]-cysteine S-methyltransferase